jgi:hypothetical protein
MQAADLDRLNVKFHLDAPAGFDSDPLLAVFSRWRLEQGEELIDLADYMHVPEGPGVLLVGHRYHFGIDFGGGQPGVFYSSRKGLSGPPAQRLRGVLRACLEKAKRLFSEPEVPKGLKLRPERLEVVLNDRVVAPNDDATDSVWRPAVAEVLDALYGKGAYELERAGGAGERLSYRACARPGTELNVETLLARLAGN